MDMNAYIGNVIIGLVISTLGLLAEHYALLLPPWRLSEPWNYAAGILTILGGCAVWAWYQQGPIDPWLAVIAFGIIAIGSGFWVVVAYAAEGRLRLLKKTKEAIAQRKAAIAGALDDTLDDLRRN